MILFFFLEEGERDVGIHAYLKGSKEERGARENMFRLM